eukprot:COSAG02_NODE_4582_length_5188_cov_2.108166_1_plen_476_part_10
MQVTAQHSHRLSVCLSVCLSLCVCVSLCVGSATTVQDHHHTTQYYAYGKDTQPAHTRSTGRSVCVSVLSVRPSVRPSCGCRPACPHARATRLLTTVGRPTLQRFLEDAACPLLVASCTDGGVVQLSNAVDAAALGGAGGRPTLAFIKTRPVAINTGNMLTVVTSSTLQSSPLESLAAALAHVYAPLVKAQSGAQAGRLQTVLAELRAGLASELRLKGVSSAGQFNEDDASAVQSPADEFNLWTELAARGDSRAREIAALFEPIARRWEELPDSTNEEDVLETLETTQDALDDVWKLPHSRPYPQARMQRLMEVAASAISRYIHGQLSSLDLWTTSYPKVERCLSYALRVCRRFVEVTETLTGQYWATFPSHPWKGEAHSDDLLKRLEKRLDEILSLRTVNHELNALLTAGEQHELRVSEHFAPFAHLPALATSDYNAPRWAAAVAEYEKQMVPVEQRIAEKLKDQMHGALLPSLRA